MSFWEFGKFLVSSIVNLMKSCEIPAFGLTLWDMFIGLMAVSITVMAIRMYFEYKGKGEKE